MDGFWFFLSNGGGVFVTLIAQTGTIIWWASKQTERSLANSKRITENIDRIDIVETKASLLESRVSVLESQNIFYTNTLNELRNDIHSVERKLDDLIKALIKTNV
jgi:hypothetical protein